MKSLEKFDLSKKDLPHIPLFEGEENLQYLSLEINLISKIDQLISLNNLIYLNLYCNRINEIENLQNSKCCYWARTISVRSKTYNAYTSWKFSTYTPIK